MTGGEGYQWISQDGKWLSLHRTVLERVIGRPLVRGESVHHKNGIRDDNRPENLELWVGPTMYGVRATDAHCAHCGAASAL